MKKAITILFCLMFCPLTYATGEDVLVIVKQLQSRVETLESRLEEKDTEIAELKKQEQIQMLQRQMESLVGEKGEQPLIEQPKMISKETLEREPKVSFKVKPGFNMLSFQADRDNGQWRENTAGFGTSAELDVRVLDPLKFNLTFDGSIIREKGSLQSGLIVANDFDDARIRLYTGSPNIKYRVLSSDRVTADMSLGYEFLGAQIRQRDIEPTGAFENVDIFGHGPRVGIATKFYPLERLSFGAEAFYTSFFDVKWEVTDARDARTEGHAFRWDLGADYSLTERLTVGGGYRGYLLNTDLSTVRVGDRSHVFYPKTETRLDHIYFSAGIKY